MEETAEHNEVAATYEEADQDFASCPREEHEQKDLNPPCELLRARKDRTNREMETGASTAASAADREVEPERLANLRVQADATGTEDVAGQLQQLVSVVGVLARRLARVEAASASWSLELVQQRARRTEKWSQNGWPICEFKPMMGTKARDVSNKFLLLDHEWRMAVLQREQKM
ncbi:hypothetical protein AK812_SmicGene4724 [Symbiodinium microadriaticum]|uniref:Uncharacterized protein n=1 Tax=Symbiodinium microadriaticum TaxID=2951 RepID=A0A1Q9EVE3_SYMMI|nr:hypothetical protein AK812_SmicGene4724 [Symbiodinium microadriaticum]CAE7857652.1 unnamed protein product [Symbiodinium microadriaticum]